MKVHIVYGTYGEGEFDVQKIFLDEAEANSYLAGLKEGENERERQIQDRQRARGTYPYGPPHVNKAEFGVRKFEVEDA